MTPSFLQAGRSITGAAGVSSVTGGVSDPRDPGAGGNRTQLVQSSSRVGFLSEFGSGVTDVTQGRMSLLILDTLIILLIGFYLWTHKVQGGG
jgi:hypothetical protein